MQDTDYQLFASSVEEELSLGIQEDCKEKVDAALEALELSEYREQHPAALSGGQKQRVTIGAAIVKDSPVIYFDEPTSGLDYDSMVRVSRLIEQLSAYVQSTGKKYADHAATLRIWAKRQKTEKKTTPGIPDYTFVEGESL